MRPIGGEKRDRYGWRVYVKVGGKQLEQRFPRDSTPTQRRNWRTETHVALTKLKPEASEPG